MLCLSLPYFDVDTFGKRERDVMGEVLGTPERSQLCRWVVWLLLGFPFSMILVFVIVKKKHEEGKGMSDTIRIQIPLVDNAHYNTIRLKSLM